MTVDLKKIPSAFPGSKPTAHSASLCLVDLPRLWQEPQIPAAVPEAELGRVDDGLPLFENGRLGQRRMPRSFAVAGLAADGRLDEFLRVEVDSGGVAAAAFDSHGCLSQLASL